MCEKEWILLPGLRNVFNKFSLVAKEYLSGDANYHNRPILLIGDSGVGKGLFIEVARKMFSQVGNHSAQFVRLNCATFSKELIESEIFGHEKGAFTGAIKEKMGLVEFAKGGLLILDEVGELSKKIQAKLLVFIEEGEYRRVGSEEIQHARVKIIGTTNKSGVYREDFWYRFFPIFIPPVCERRLDVLYFIAYKYLDVFKRLTTQHALSLLAYHWPGNIREVERVVSSLMVEDSLDYKNSASHNTDRNVPWRPLIFPVDSRLTSLSISSLHNFFVKLIKSNFDIGSLCKIISKHGINFHLMLGIYNEIREGLFNNKDAIVDELISIVDNVDINCEDVESSRRELEKKPGYKLFKEETSSEFKTIKLMQFDEDRRDDFYRELVSQQDFEKMERLYGNICICESLPNLAQVGSCFDSLCKLFLKNPLAREDVFDSTEIFISDSEWNDPLEKKLFDKFYKKGLVKNSLEFIFEKDIESIPPLNYYLSWGSYIELLMKENKITLDSLSDDDNAPVYSEGLFDLKESELLKKYYTYLLDKYKTIKMAAEHTGLKYDAFCKRLKALNFPQRGSVRKQE